MPHKKKSKLRFREKHRQAREDAQATAAEEKASTPSSLPPGEGSPQEPQRAPASTAGAAGASCTRAVEGAQSQDEASASSSAAGVQSSQIDPLTRRVNMLLQFLLEKYKKKEPVSKAEMIKIISKKYKKHFSEILQRVTEHMELVFGLDLKEADSKAQVYVIVSKLQLSREENLNDSLFPKNGMLMPLLCMIYMRGNRVSEEEVWKFLKKLEIYDGEMHFIFGDPRKLITEALVQEKYLEYQQVPGSDPPRFEFLLGPGAHDNKTKILEFLANFNAF
ncbi:PREDICTED: melanoma-associated antigen B1-like [Elephantulus edwardii]|uniref:melanoma-associated antigen B1-like n=1 Tax=Elephantulus edwardii TaxID=28737 RepID=UPI0003F06C48|nr:PREDICTED: melanoma-associated antigen B1-like [Elephantulus edwardii]